MDVFMFFFLISSVWAAQNPFRSEIAPITLTNTNQGTMEVLIAIPKGYHLYKDMMSIQAVESNGVTFYEPELPKGLFQSDPANPSQYREHYEETIVINVPFTVGADGSYVPKVEVRYQGCKKGLCYKPAIDIHAVVVTKKAVPKPSPVPIPSVVYPLWRSFQVSYFRFSSQSPKQ
ncbi:MAG: hypothetical protein CL916_05150 [Deltaproteobacteria bacterium]|nr:hypothetical protein [Deltaproteobacteria bacterium]